MPGIDEADDASRLARARGTSGAVHVIGILGGRIPVDDARHGIDVDAACSNVGGDENVGPSAAECLKGRSALRLRAVAVDDDR